MAKDKVDEPKKTELSEKDLEKVNGGITPQEQEALNKMNSVFSRKSSISNLFHTLVKSLK